MPSATVIAAVSYDLEELLKENGMLFDQEKFSTSPEYVEEVKDLLYDTAFKDFTKDFGELLIHDSDIPELMD